MKNLNYFSAIILMLVITSACDMEQIIPGTGLTDDIYFEDARKAAKGNALKVTGSVELIWKGGTKGSDKGNKPEELLTFLDISAHGRTASKDPKGEIVYTVLEPDYSLHREIIAQVLDVQIGYEKGKEKAFVVAIVISDSKGCAGDGHSGHDDTCGGSVDDHSGHDGGCSHEDSDEGGCSDSHTDEGGCSTDVQVDVGGSVDVHEEGGCSDEHTDEGGCSGSDSGSDDHGGSPGGSPGGADKGNPMSGKNCRIGQIIALKTHDGGLPSRSDDGITWKWFPNTEFVNGVGETAAWPHLCKKDIIGGNIVIHQ